MYEVKIICLIFLGKCLALNENHKPDLTVYPDDSYYESQSEFINRNKTTNLQGNVTKENLILPLDWKKEVVEFRNPTLNESTEKIQLMNNKILLKSTFVPILPKELLPNATEGTKDLDNEDLQNTKSIETSEFLDISNKYEADTNLKRTPSVINNNSIVTRNGKKYRVVKVKKNVVNTGSAEVERNVIPRRTFRTFKLFPNMLSVLPIKWMSKEQKSDKMEAQMKTDDERLWSKLNPIKMTDVKTTATPANQSLESSDKIKKILNLFTIVKLDNKECYTKGIKGVCQKKSECQAREGKYVETCAKESGVCCYNEKTCGQRTKDNETYFVNEGFPESSTTAPKICTLTVEKAGPEVKQLRLDFLEFQLRDPKNGTCIHDRFVVTGQNTNDIIPEICGSNTGQHIYVDVEETNGPYNLNIVTMGEFFPRNYRIRITQLTQTDELLAPKNCLQYHVESNGIVQSFNYQYGVNEIEGESFGGYFNNLNYAICIKKLSQFCSISYENEETDDTQPTFQFLNVDEEENRLLPPGQAGAETFDCPDDYIVINGVRLCGEKLNDGTTEIDFTKNYPVTDTSYGPFILFVRTDASVAGLGFYLRYKQIPCPV